MVNKKIGFFFIIDEIYIFMFEDRNVGFSLCFINVVYFIPYLFRRGLGV